MSHCRVETLVISAACCPSPLQRTSLTLPDSQVLGVGSEHARRERLGDCIQSALCLNVHTLEESRAAVRASRAAARRAREQGKEADAPRAREG